MRIGSSDIRLHEDRFYAKAHNEKETLRASRGNVSIFLESESSSGTILKEKIDDEVLISELGKEELRKKQSENISVNEETGEFKISLSEKQKQEMRLISELLSAFSGKKIEFNMLEDIEGQCGKPECSETATDPEEKILKNPTSKKDKDNSENSEEPAPEDDEISYEYTRHTSHYEHERMDFSASGKVITSDGREIEIKLNLHMSRDFASEEFERITSGKQIDPIVINYDGKATELTEEKYEFDLDYNGTPDEISFVKEGSGFLARDSNGNGKIDDGRELFGPGNGDGFKELAKYDEDGNGWIDENDSIFEELLLITKDDQGNDHVFSLKEKNIGALYLEGTETTFNFRDGTNASQGTMRKSSVYLTEDGKTGAMHHIDLNV